MSKQTKQEKAYFAMMSELKNAGPGKCVACDMPMPGRGEPRHECYGKKLQGRLAWESMRFKVFLGRRMSAWGPSKSTMDPLVFAPGQAAPEQKRGAP